MYFSFTQPIWEETKQIKEDIKDHSDSLVRVSNFNQRIIDLTARKDNLNKAQIDRMKVMAPADLDETGVMADIQAIVERNRARLLTVGVSEWTGATSQSLDEGEAGDKVAGLQELEHSTKDISITVESTYEQIKRVLSDLERSLVCLLYTSPSPRDRTRSRMPSSA